MDLVVDDTDDDFAVADDVLAVDETIEDGVDDDFAEAVEDEVVLTAARGNTPLSCIKPRLSRIRA